MEPKNRAPHPGKILQKEFLDPLGISQSALARHIGQPPHVICEIVNGKRNISTRMACLLSQSLNTEPIYWLSHQADYDLSVFWQSDEGERAMALEGIVSCS